MKRTKSNSRENHIPNHLIVDTLRSGGHLTVNWKMVHTFGITMAGYIANLLEKRVYFQEKGWLEDDGSFYLTHEDQMEDLGLGEKAVKTCKKKLQNMGILYNCMKGQPAKEYYYIDLQRLYKLVFDDNQRRSSDPPAREGLDGSPREGLYIPPGYSNKNKGNKNKGGENKKKKSQKKNKDRLPTQKMNGILLWYNSNLAQPYDLPRCMKLSNGRRKALNARYKDGCLDHLNEIKEQINHSAFLQGNGGRNTWRGADFDFIFGSPNNWVKIIEGRYRDNGKTDDGDSSDEDIDKLRERMFPDDVVWDGFNSSVLSPAKRMVNDGTEDRELEAQLIKFYRDIKAIRDQNMNDSVVELMPGIIELMGYYMEWIENAHWLQDVGKSLFRTTSTVFNKFRIDASNKRDNRGRDLITGK